MDRRTLLDGLVDGGLSEYQADAYLTLLERGTSPAVDVAKNCSIPVPRIYDILNELEQMGYVETLDRDKLHARACDPVEFIEDLHHKSARLSDVASEIEDRWEQSPLGEHEINVTKHAQTVLDHAENKIREAEWVVDLAVTERQLVELEGALGAATENDVVVRASVYSPGGDSSVLDDHPVRDVVTEIRARSIRGPFLAVMDRTVACLAPTERMPDPYGVVVNDELISFIFQWYFQTCLWAVWETEVQRRRYPVRYVSLKEFVCDVYPAWWEDAIISVTVEGIDTTSGEKRVVSGVLMDVLFPGKDLSGTAPSLTQLAGQATIVVRTPDQACTVGGWGALIEDVEARRITIDAIEWPA